MSKKVSLTVHPAPLSGEYLTVSDAMNQVLDLIEALGRSESIAANERQVVWRLTEAYTNSPPFTIVAEPFPVRPELSVAMEASRVAGLFANNFQSLLGGEVSDLVRDAVTPVKRVLERNLNRIGQTVIEIEGEPSLSILPSNARSGILAIEKSEILIQEKRTDWQRTELGTVEGEISGLTRWNGKPALEVIERLSEKPFTCVLREQFSKEIGPLHVWNEVWEGRRVYLTGALHYNSNNVLKRADIDQFEEVEWTDVSLSDLKNVDVLQGRTMAEHLEIVRSHGDG